MTDATDSAEARGPGGEALAIAIAAVLILAAVLYLSSQRQQVLRASPAGFDGLQAWLTSEGVGAQSFSGGWLIDEASVGLLIVPLFDTALDRAREPATSKEELLLQQDEYDLDAESLIEKARRLPTLIVLPKWRSGLRLTGLGHPILLVERSRPEAILRKLTGDPRARLTDARTPFTTLREVSNGNRRAEIYAARTFRAEGCRRLVGMEGAMLFADCPLAAGGAEARVLILSDPDFLNNHGLRLGQNAEIARDLIASRAEGRTVLIDYSREVWLRDEDTGVRRERTWADLARFFGPPFLALWIGAGLALALAIWRGALRFGPVASGAALPSASKSHAIDARARLMRLTGQDGALLAEYARARIAAVAATIFGPAHARHYAGQDAFLRYVHRRHPQHAAELERIVGAVTGLPPRVAPAEAIRHVDDLERILERITHDT